MWSPPDTVAEFEIVRPIGAGAMGRVFLARDSLLGRTVAIKFVAANEVSELTRERFFREARAIARLAHPNVVGIHRIGEFRQRPYLVSEYLEGESLDRAAKPLGWSRAVAIAIGIARGLAAAHQRDVLHRDIKPANVMLGPDGTAKLLDFGLASIAGEEARPAAHPRRQAPDEAGATTSIVDRPAHPAAGGAETHSPEPLAGTPLYMAPELWAGQPASRASDIYALGIVLYELLAGGAPGAGCSIDQLRARATTPIDDLESLAPSTPTALLRLVMSCVDLDPARRPASVDAILEQLELLRAPLAIGSPYRGLLAFHSEQRDLFFGRNHDIATLVERLRRDAFVVVAGDSGIGKSSLCRAGVLPAFIDQEGSRWRVRTITPGARPLQTLDELELGDQPTIVFVDQLEELVTLAPVEQRDLAARRLVELAARPNACRVLATARSDFLGRLAELDALGGVLQRSLVLVGPLSERGLREAVTTPAKLAGYQLEPDLVAELVVSGRRSLPLLQFALHELWDHRDEASKQVSLSALTAIGGVGGALAKHADRVMAGFDEPDRDLAWQLLLRLVTADGTRASVPFQSLIDLATVRADGERIVEALVQARLIVVQPDAERRVEVAHEALFSKWPRLVEWRRAHDHDARFRDRLLEAAAHWRERGRPRGLLWRGNALGEYRAWRARWQEPLAPFEREFGAASEGDARRFKRILIGVVAAIVIGLATGVLLLYRADRRTQAQQRILFADQASAEHAGGYDQRALPYLLQLRRDGEDSAALDLAISDATRDSRRATGRIVSGPRGALDVKWAPGDAWFVGTERGGRLQVADPTGVVRQTWDAERELGVPSLSERGTIATTDQYGAVWLFELGSATPTKLVPQLRGPERKVFYRSVAFEPGGSKIAAIGPDGVTRLWESSRLIAELGEPGLEGRDMLATRDLFVTCREGGLIRAWRWSDHELVLDGTFGETTGCSLGATPRGDLIAALGNRALIWDPDRRSPPRVIENPLGVYLGDVQGNRVALFEGSGKVDVYEVDTLHKVGGTDRSTGGAHGVDLSPDGKRVVVSGSDGFFRMFDVESRIERFAIAATPFAGTSPNAPQGAMAARFTRDGKTLLTRSGVDFRLWRLDDWPVVARPRCDCNLGLVARWSPDESAIAVAGMGFARIVDRPDREIGLVSTGISWKGWDAAWSADGTRVLVVGDDGYAKLFARDGALIRDLPGHRAHVNHAVRSPDGRMFATASDDHFVRIFDSDGALLHSFDVGTRVVSVAWSPDNKRVAAAGYDGSVPIWSVSTEQLEQRLFDPSTQFLDLDFSPDGNQLATAGHDNVVRIWDLASGGYRELLGHLGPVTGVAWSPDGGLIASSAELGGIRIWDPVSGREIARRDVGSVVMSLQWSHDGRRLLVPALDNGIYVLDVSRDPVPLGDLERLVEAGAWELVDGRLVRKQNSFRPR